MNKPSQSQFLDFYKVMKDQFPDDFICMDFESIVREISKTVERDKEGNKESYFDYGYQLARRKISNPDTVKILI
jgi:hypothetical protein